VQLTAFSTAVQANGVHIPTESPAMVALCVRPTLNDPMLYEVAEAGVLSR